jgi:uncharacterized protein
MDRKQINFLKHWQSKANRKPLIVNGARQVGKTWLLKTFGKENYKNIAYINFENTKSISTVLLQTFDINRILQAIQIEVGFIPEPQNTLIIFDEIQASPQAITILKYFYEIAPQYHIACASSLLGIALAQNTSFPVGKVEFMDLYPMNFEEFLKATNNVALFDAIEKKDWQLVDSFKDKITNLLRTYYYIGGMPEAVLSYIQNLDFELVRSIQNNILKAYELDFSKHAPTNIVPRIRMLWEAIPAQLAKENRKFIFKAVKEGSRAKDYEMALQWLIDAGLVNKICNLKVPKIPLKVYEQTDIYKLYIHDVGLLAAKSELSVQTILYENAEFKGALTEQFVLQEIKSSIQKKIYYWSATNSQAEIDFILEHSGNIYPIEVKAEENLQSKSLIVFFEKYNPKYTIRFSMSNYRNQGWLQNIPLYGASQLLPIIDENQ